MTKTTAEQAREAARHVIAWTNPDDLRGHDEQALTLATYVLAALPREPAATRREARQARKVARERTRCRTCNRLDGLHDQGTGNADECPRLHDPVEPAADARLAAVEVAWHRFQEGVTSSWGFEAEMRVALSGAAPAPRPGVYGEYECHPEDQ